MKTREYQQNAINDIVVCAKKQPVLLVSPTGSGKTFIIAQAAKRIGGPVVAIANRVEIRHQIQNSMSDIGVDCTCYGNTSAELPNALRKAKLVFIDEAHHTPSRTWARAHRIALEAGAQIVGATATPYRADRAKLTGLYPKWIHTKSAAELMKEGHLAKLRYVASVGVDFSQIKRTRKNELDLDSAFNQVRVLVQAGDLIHQWNEFAPDTKAIIYCATLPHVELVGKELSMAGVSFASVTSRTSKKNRDSAIEDFDNSKITALVNCSVFTEGTDLKGVGCIIVLRPTLSRSLYAQMIGRGLRPDCECTAIDLVGNWNIHGDVLSDDIESIINGANLSDAKSGEGTVDSYEDIRKSILLDIVHVHSEFDVSWMPASISECAI